MRERSSVMTMVRVIACILIAVVSITVITPVASKPESYKSTIEKLDNKEKVIMGVTATATAASIGLALFPDDATTPVANKIMDLVGYLVLVLSAIVMEKYLLTMAGYVVFKWLVPIVCLVILINTFVKSQALAKVATKILILGLAVLLVVPISVRMSDMIENTYEISNSVSEDEDILDIEAESLESDVEEIVEEKATEEEEESGNWFSRAISDASDMANQTKEKAKEIAKAAVSYVTEVADDTVKNAQKTLWDLIEKVVVLLVTNCVLPILVLMFLFWIINLITGIQISLPNPKQFMKKMHKKTDINE